ncbi:nitric oxide reductase activation protein NorD [Comamonas sp. GB3 AK4-5]|uniref:nitric oxide reductase activation protein NorD n=1 Tax=Comamonas sp. GB3 AK4-5 TaxID=3231487 RepID=UPI00351DD4B4
MRISEPHTQARPDVLREWGRVSAHWRSGDQALLALAMERQLPLLQRLLPAKDWPVLLELLDGLHAAHPSAALAVAGQLGMLLQQLDVQGLRRWILTGLRSHEAGSAEIRGAYFRLQSHSAIQSMHAEAAAMPLTQAMPSLAWLLHLLAGEAIAVQPRAQPLLHVAPDRPVLDAGHGLFLPDSYTARDGADHWALLRAAVAHAAAHWRYSPRKQSGRGLKPMGHAVVGALEDARVEWLLAQAYPGVQRWFVQAFVPTASLQQRSDFEGLLARLHCALANPLYVDEHGWIAKARTLFQELQLRGDLFRPAPLREAASVLANDLGQMRLRMNLQGFHVPAAYRDDNSFLWDLGENTSDPAPELLAQSVLRPQETQPARPDNGDVQPAPGATPMDPVSFFYPEWDYRLERLRPDWCTVYERQPPLAARSRTPADAAAIGPHWRLARRSNRHMRLRRQLQGDELDLDAAIDWSVDRRAGRDPSAHIFRGVGRAAPLLHLLVLVDLSQSCNDLLEGHAGLTLLGLQKKALTLLAQRVDRSSVRLAIHGFHSDTRHAVSYFRLLEFGQPWDGTGEGCIHALQAGYSTRLGAALRHASHIAATVPAAQRAVVVLSDGAPADIDVFDPRYLVEDARAAVRAAQRTGVAVVALGIGQVDAAQMRQIYGRGGYGVARNPLELPQRLLGLIARLAR